MKDRQQERKKTQPRPRLHWALLALFIAGLSLFMSRYASRSFGVVRQSPPMLKELLDPQKGTFLAPLLKPRVAGTRGGIDAREHITKQLEKHGWSVDIHNFTAQVPFGEVPMANIVSRRISSLAQGERPKLTLAAHYDSKKVPEGFVGAIDSAFPCALLMWLATLPEPKRDFDLIFFDGEEAFGEWSADDSLYGARALAKHQQETNTLPSTLVLLDLIGHEDRHPIPSWFPNTQPLHKELQRINPRLVGGRNLHEYAGMMEDDHIPYLKLSVPVLHLIPPSFPPEWHTLGDNADLLHWPTMEAWAHMLQEWLF